jgi:iron complex transport system substrate-binding protein
MDNHGISRRDLLKYGTLSAAGIISASALTACSSSSNSTGTTTSTTRIITDDAGREVTVPAVADLTSVYCTSPMGELYLFTLAPQLAGGTNSTYSEAELKYLPAGTANLKNYGTWAMNGTLDNEAIMAAGIQVLLDVSSATIADSDITAADDLQDQTGIPVLLYDGSVDKTPDAYRAIGELLGTEDHASELAAYCETTYENVTAAVATVPDADRVTVYYAEGPDGLKTEPETSPHFATFLAAGAKDVATCELTKGSGMTTVSLENVIAWNPQVIIAWNADIDGGADETIRTSSDWASIDAVRDGRVYTIPCLPFTWGDRPPSVTRYIGMQWLANKLYPNAYGVDTVQVTEEFYKLFFSVDLTDAEAKAVLFED